MEESFSAVYNYTAEHSPPKEGEKTNKQNKFKFKKSFKLEKFLCVLLRQLQLSPVC